MMHFCRAHMGHQLCAEAVAQLRALDRAACQICGSIRKRTNPRCAVQRRLELWYWGIAFQTREDTLGQLKKYQAHLKVSITAMK